MPWNQPTAPYLLTQAVDHLLWRSGGLYVDGTFGGGGHTREILDRDPGNRAIAFDLDVAAIERGEELRRSVGADRLTVIHDNFATLARHLDELGIDCVDGVLLDLGMSSYQLDDAERGFAFRFDGPLDMRFDQTTGQTAADLITTADERDLADIIWRYGEERRSRQIARALVAQRDRNPIETTGQLAAIVARIVGRGKGGTHPATRTFQALRIAVNHEFEMLEQALEAAVEPVDASWPIGRDRVPFARGSNRQTIHRAGVRDMHLPARAGDLHMRHDTALAPVRVEPEADCRGASRQSTQSFGRNAGGGAGGRIMRGAVMPPPIMLSEVMVAAGARLLGELAHDTAFRWIERDSRVLQPGDLFIAVRGEQFDGHDFVSGAASKGAAAALVSVDWAAENAANAPLPLLVVPDPVLALQEIARSRRKQRDVTVVGITGSIGKTSTKEVVAAVIGQTRMTYRSPGNLNSEIGLPLSLLEIAAGR